MPFSIKRGGGRLAEDLPVIAREAAEMPETEPGSDIGHGGFVRCGRAQCAMGKAHAAQEKIMLRTNAELLLATCPECPFRHADRGANFRHIQRTIRIALHRVAKSLHYCFVVAVDPR